MKLSIIIPVYNKFRYLSSCLDSIVSQIDSGEYRYELLLIDDGSTDGSSEIIESFSKRYDYISVYSQANAGVSVARNRGIGLATGDYVIFVDADDELIEGSLINVFNYLESHPDINMLVTRQVRAQNGQIKLESKFPFEEGLPYTGVEAYKRQYIRTNAGGGICSLQFLKEHNILFPVGVKNSEDTIFFGIVQMLSKSIIFLNIPFYKINEVYGSAARVDEYKLALRNVDTIASASKIRKEIQYSEEQMGIFEYIIYQLLSDSVYHFANASELSFKDFVKMIKPKTILPINTSYMCISTRKAKLMNASYPIFYFISKIKSLLNVW